MRAGIMPAPAQALLEQDLVDAAAPHGDAPQTKPRKGAREMFRANAWPTRRMSRTASTEAIARTASGWTYGGSPRARRPSAVTSGLADVGEPLGAGPAARPAGRDFAVAELAVERRAEAAFAKDVRRLDRPGACAQAADRVHARRPQTTVVLDTDSSVSETHGRQEGSAENGHFRCTRYHPPFVFNQFGDLERCALRPGNVHSADGWRHVLEPVVARYRHQMKRRYFRGDAARAMPEIYEFLEAGGYKYTIRLPAKAVLQESVAWLPRRPVGRPPHEVRRYHASFSYRAGSWTRPRRVVATVEWHPGELYPRVGFVVTNMARPAERVVAFYTPLVSGLRWAAWGRPGEGSAHGVPVL
jgi:hypothetical protein